MGCGKRDFELQQVRKSGGCSDGIITPDAGGGTKTGFTESCLVIGGVYKKRQGELMFSCSNQITTRVPFVHVHK